MSQLQKSRFTLDYALNERWREMQAIYNTLTGAFIVVSSKDWSLIQKGAFDRLELGFLDTLIENGFLVNENVDEAALYETWWQQYVHDFSNITSMVMVTQNCNFNCVYCILAHAPIEMSAETALAMDRFYLNLINTKKPARVQDDYLGGEPLLNPNVILESAARRFYYCLGKGVEYGFSVTTNGFLIKSSLIEKLKGVGLKRIRISVAGPADIHNRLRPLKGGGETFDRILKNLQSISGKVPIHVEYNYLAWDDSYLRFSEMMTVFQKTGIDIEGVSSSPIQPSRGKDLPGAGTGDPNKFIFLKHEAASYGFSVYDESLNYKCGADMKAAFVFNPDGSLSGCPSVGCGELTYGHVKSGIDFVKEAQMLRRRLPEKCRQECALLPFCHGGCRNLALVKEGDFWGIDCNYDMYAAIFEDHIRHKAEEALANQDHIIEAKAA